LHLRLISYIAKGREFVADAIISNPVTYGHIHVAESLSIPLHIMFPQVRFSSMCERSNSLVSCCTLSCSFSLKLLLFAAHQVSTVPQPMSDQSIAKKMCQRFVIYIPYGRSTFNSSDIIKHQLPYPAHPTLILTHFQTLANNISIALVTHPLHTAPASKRGLR
jgi:hypothetical protein